MRGYGSKAFWRSRPKKGRKKTLNAQRRTPNAQFQKKPSTQFNFFPWPAPQREAPPRHYPFGDGEAPGELAEGGIMIV